MSKTVGIAMSGGVDSACAAILLKDSGCSVIGFTFNLFNASSNIETNPDAGNVAKQIGIQHHTVDLTDDFKRLVIEPYRIGYSQGLTPNPCAICNRLIKWGVLRDIMLKYGCEYIATGHYARIEKRDERYILKRGIDHDKDQSYFLYFLNQSLLEKTILPLGKYTKVEVRKIIADRNLNIENKPESQDLCFISGQSDQDAIFEDMKKGMGDIVDKSGKIIGKHKGLENYTVGQRRGLDIAHSSRLYVLSKDARDNKLIVGEKEDLFQSAMNVHSFVSSHPGCPEPDSSPFACHTRIRYRTPATNALFTRLSETDARIEFDNPVSGIAPGQIAVVYDNDEVIGGGIISPD